MRKIIHCSVMATALLSVTACGPPALPLTEHDMCTDNAEWIYTGRPAGQLNRVSANIEERLAKLTEKGVVGAAAQSFLDAIKEGDAEVILVASEQLATTCMDEGWEPPEG